jgi:ferric-dicitrate binding protein FerR (iron transport regulator)
MKEVAVTDRMMELAEKWLDGSITEQEKAEFTEWYNQFNDELATVRVSPHVLQRDMLKDILARVHAERLQPPPMATRPVKQWMRYAAVAIGLFLISSAGYFLLHKKGARLLTPLANKSHSIQDISPGKKKAVLTLADGSGIVLDSAHNGAIALQGNSRIMKSGNGSLAYQPVENPSAGKVIFNTLTTPRGGQYELKLGDGTMVWLNSASSITYPASFAKNKREISITGEVFLQVAKDAARPFIVSTRNAVSLEVLGTSFNINAYADEPSIDATLLEGRLQVTQFNSRVTIRPGQQAACSDTHVGLTVTDDVDLQQVVAWKNGLFQFHNAGLPAVLRQISRWYDVDIRYEGDIPVREFEGKIQRNLTLLQVLKILEKNQVHLTLEGRTIIVKNTK